MPVSSPSYFPALRGTDQIVGINAGQSQTGARVFLAGQSAAAFSTISDLIIIGHNAYQNATDAGIAGSVVIGSGSLPIAPTASLAANLKGPNTVLGYNNLPTINQATTGYLSSCVVIGSNVGIGWIPAATEDYSGSVMIGERVAACEGAQAFGAQSMSQNVIIGHRALRNPSTSGQGINGSIVIGAFCLAGSSGVTNSVVIGGSIVGANGAMSLTTCIGYGANAAGPNCVIIGEGVSSPFGGAANHIVVIGSSAGNAFFADASSGRVAIGGLSGMTVLPSARGNIAIGNGLQGSHPTAAVLYSTGGVLHTVDSSNNDTTLGVGAGQLAATIVGYASNAAAAAGTLTNAPIAGNPTKWIPINDNGTIRNIPAW